MAEENPDNLAAEVEKAEEQGGGGGGPFVTLLLLVNAIVLSVIAYIQFSAHQKEANRPDIRDIIRAEMQAGPTESEATAGADQQKNDGILMPLDPFTANLAQGDGPRRFVRMTAVLKFSKSSKEDEFKARKPQIRDTVISILNSKRPEDLLKVEGKTYLKEEIKSAINSFLVDGNVLDVFYVGFQIN